uniref:Uncharacterized protein n=1 Tax=Arundo donax TaxID=35708 RepID=A0A0A8XQB4_ARUDO
MLGRMGKGTEDRLLSALAFPLLAPRSFRFFTLSIGL